MLKVVLRAQAAPRHQGISDAHGSSISKCHSDVEIIILLKERIFNDVKNIALVLIPVFVSHLRGNALKLISKTVAAGNIIIAFQHGGHGVAVLGMIFPQVDAVGIISAAGVGHIEHLAESGLIPGGINDGDSF